MQIALRAAASCPVDRDARVELDAEGLISVLNQYGVRYVVIGGIAALLHGSGLTTMDLDITPARDDENLDRLAKALGDLQAHLRVSEGPPVAFPAQAAFLRQMSLLTLRTRLGDLDVCFTPTAPGRGLTFDYERLKRDAVVVELPEPVAVASLDDVISSKEAAARDKDLAVLGTLYRLREILSAPEDG